ncbi:exodeoxyribonuclease III (exonuclease III) [Campylobacter blaseri]|uniref:Exodeoxyribonuclease III n=1 Tax=Campylobacter blaseri TaxID=2042961 RepID=A0A2P8R478_9BACT|nr:exodeoxyribonuclease III [Campylobacter blaseri]PSM53273.1 exodeoxyribonuclease III [Campylobacter blaseri]PSM54739.1 exodeoxyribonuclease III [Campylobacter blaseri]QKF86779.1 exodeoxyribonuclease III (exonuclease III) [Campylobacter blaseri]
MKLFSWNVNGIRAVVNKDGFDWLKDYKPDFLGLQEVKATEDQIPNEIYNLGFDEVTLNSAARPGYSGVMSLANFDTITTNSMFFEDDEGRVLEHRFKNIVLFNIYFPNGQKDEERLNYKMKFYDKFLNYADGLQKDGFDIIICGDVNTAHNEIDLKNPQANSKRSGFLDIERAWIDRLLENGFIDTFRYLYPKEAKYSWWTYRFNARANNAGWRIDYFFISDSLKDKLKDAFILNDVFGSDHCPVGIEIDI